MLLKHLQLRFAGVNRWMRTVRRVAVTPVSGRMVRPALVVALVLASVPAPSAAPRQLGLERRAGRIGRMPRTAELRRVSAIGDDTYLADILARNTVLRRWRLDVEDTVRVWISYGSAQRRVRQSDRYAVRDAFHTWSATGVPVHFTFVADSAWAQVHVVWRDRLPDGRAGQVTRSPDESGWLHGALLELAVHSASGRRFDPATRRAVATHEVGHVLGLEHSPDSTDIMAAWVRARALSDRDRATVRLVYGMPAEPKPIVVALDTNIVATAGGNR